MNKTSFTALALAALLLSCVPPVPAETLATWSGAGLRACSLSPSACSREWIASIVRGAAEAFEAHPDGDLTTVEPGDYLSAMAYQVNGRPTLDERGTLVVRERPAAARAWRLDGFDLLLIEECGNWAIRPRATPIRPYRSAAALMTPIGGVLVGNPASAGGGGFGGSGGFGGGTDSGDDCDCDISGPILIVWPPHPAWPPVVPPAPPAPDTPPAVVPLPGSLAMLVAAIGGMVLIGSRR